MARIDRYIYKTNRHILVKLSQPGILEETIIRSDNCTFPTDSPTIFPSTSPTILDPFQNTKKQSKENSTPFTYTTSFYIIIFALSIFILILLVLSIFWFSKYKAKHACLAKSASSQKQKKTMHSFCTRAVGSSKTRGSKSTMAKASAHQNNNHCNKESRCIQMRVQQIQVLRGRVLVRPRRRCIKGSSQGCIKKEKRGKLLMKLFFPKLTFY